MCGIAGIVDAQQSLEGLARYLERADAVQRHRGPDDHGSLVEACGRFGVGLGHQRLSIIDLTEAGHQPLVAPGTGNVIVYNGEVYNYLELRSELQAEGVVFESDTDTEVVAAAIDSWGVREALTRFNGMWAFALLDRRRRRLILARDRAGIKPLYWSVEASRLTFASELKGLLAMSDARHTLDLGTVRAYLTQSLIDFSPDTLFEDVEQVPSGCFVEVDLSGERLAPRVERYWQPPVEPQESERGRESEPELAEEIAGVFRDAVRLRLRSDVPVGVLLSGGLDSSAIASMAVRSVDGSPVALLAAVSDDRRFDESAHVRRVAGHLGTSAHEVHIDLTPESAFALMETATWHNDAPLNSMSNLAHYKLMEAARALGVTVVLSGQGADELLCGYKKYLAFYIQSLLRAGKPLAAGLEALYSAAQGTVLRQFNLREARRYMPSWTDRRPSLTGPALASHADVELGLRPGMTLQSRQAKDLTSLSVPHLNHTEDRMSMAFGREIRLPFLDFRLIERLLPLDPHWKIHHGWTKYIFRKATEDVLPRGTAWRKDKLGFTVPESVWLRGRLKDRVLDTFDESALIFRYQLVDRPALLATYRRYLSQSEARGSVSFRDMFAPLALEVWLRAFERFIAA